MAGAGCFGAGTDAGFGACSWRQNRPKKRRCSGGAGAVAGASGESASDAELKLAQRAKIVKASKGRIEKLPCTELCGRSDYPASAALRGNHPRSEKPFPLVLSAQNAAALSC